MSSWQIQDESRIMDGLAPYNWENHIGPRLYKAIKDGLDRYQLAQGDHQ